MSNLRFKALESVLNRTPVKTTAPSDKISDYFGTNVFNELSMSEFLSKEAFKSVKDAIEQGTPVDREMADQIASGMKAWAISKGATHYTHWFQPLTGLTAETHDTFFESSPEDRKSTRLNSSH